MEKKETCVFKKGDRVFYFATGWNEITAIQGRRIELKSEKEINGESEWQIYDTDWGLLSFTEYTLQGFTQERPLPEIEKDTLVYVLDERIDEWKMRYFSHFEGNMLYAFEEQEQSTQTTSSEGWRKYSLTNPLEPCATKQG